MKREGRWESQKNLVRRITKITTRILPKDEGVALRFINQIVPNSSNLSLEGIGKIIDPMSWKTGGDTEIGTYLRLKILEPLVYSKLEGEKLERPVLVSIITDGMPDREDRSELVRSIIECGQKLQGAGYPRESASLDPSTRLFLTLLARRCQVHDWPSRNGKQCHKVLGNPQKQPGYCSGCLCYLR